MKKAPISILCGIAAILVTIISYFVIIGNIFSQIICFITLVGVVITEAIITALAYYSKGEPRKVAATIISSFMIPVSIVLSILYIVKFPKGYGSYLGWYFSAVAIILVIVAIIWKFADNRNDDNAELQNAKENMLELRKLVKCIMLKQNAENLKKELEQIEEKLHFSNDAVIVEADAKIRQMLIELENSIDEKDFNAAEFIHTISSEIDRRNIFAKNTI